MKIRSIAQKFGIWLVLVTLFVMIVFGVINYFLFINQLDKDLDVRLDESASRVADLLALHVWNLDNQRVQDVAQEQAFLESFVRLRVLDSFGDSIYETEQPAGDEKLVFIKKDIIYAENVAGSIEVAFSTENIRIAKNAIIRSTLVIIFVVVLTVLVLTFFVVRSISRPIISLTETAQEIAGGNLSKRVAVKSKDEIGQLGNAFNDMTNKLQTSYDKIKKQLEKLRTTTVSRDELAIEVTQRKQVEQLLQAANIVLASSNADLEAFSYSVAHDLRAPLRTIDGFSQALLEDYPDRLDDQGKGYLQRVRSAAQHMGDLIDDLLSLSRVNRRELNRETVDLSAVAQSIAAELQETQPERKVDFAITQGLTASGDPHLLRILLDNLFGNAWKFTGHHPQARIAFGSTQVKGVPAYFVRDDGAGFDMAYSDKLFGAFQRLHTDVEFAGTGIGLAIVQRIAHRHGGHAWAEGKQEEGATFYFTLQVE